MRNIFSQKPDQRSGPDQKPGDDGLENASAESAAAEDSTAGGDPGASPDAAFAALNSECVRLEKELGEHRENLLRRQAEFDNYRRRTERERAEFRVTATMDTVANMLPVLDGLEAALKAPASAGGAEIRK